MVATFGELGWLPLNLVLDRIRIKYFHRMRFCLPETRLCKQIFNDLFSGYSENGSNVWPYISEMRKILNNTGMDRAFSSLDPNWIYSYLKLSLASYKMDFYQEIDEMKSLKWYRLIKGSTFGKKLFI